MVSTPWSFRVMAATPAAPLCFADRAEVHATENRHVVGAVDGDRDQLAGVPSEETAVKLSVIDWPAPAAGSPSACCRRL